MLPIFVCKLVISGEENIQELQRNILNTNNELEKRLEGQYNVIVAVTKNGILGDLQFELYNDENVKQIDFKEFKQQILVELNKIINVKK